MELLNSHCSSEYNMFVDATADEKDETGEETDGNDNGSALLQQMA